MITEEFLSPISESFLPGVAAREQSHLTALESSILRAVIYADVFDFPLTALEIQKSLVKYPAPIEEVQAALNGPNLIPDYLERHDEYVALAGRKEILEERRRRCSASNRLWIQADAYGRLIAQLPFVRMVAVTGALAFNNAEPEDDIDYLIVTKPNRLWLCRAMVIMLVKRAARRGVQLCPNYFLSDRALALPERDLYTAHELLQMVPIAGFDVYQEMLALNSWAAELLPNKTPRNGNEYANSRWRNIRKRFHESILHLPPFGLVERWEMNRKIARLSNKSELPWSDYPWLPDGARRESDINDQSRDLVELSFGPDCCKGHFHFHGLRTLTSYEIQTYLMAEEC